MESLSSPKFPQIVINRAQPERKEMMEFKSISPEPEVEECCEDNQLREIVENLGIDYSSILNLKYITHDPSSRECLHCKLMDKLSALQESVNYITTEIGVTEEILKVKKIQNNDLKLVIDRLEGSFGTKPTEEAVIDQNAKTCSCSSSCVIL